LCVGVVITFGSGDWRSTAGGDGSGGAAVAAAMAREWNWEEWRIGRSCSCGLVP